MKTHRVYHRGHRRAWSAFLQASTRTSYSAQAEERLLARTSANAFKSTPGRQAEVQA
jgi:hypothetical protein